MTKPNEYKPETEHDPETEAQSNAILEAEERKQARGYQYVKYLLESHTELRKAATRALSFTDQYFDENSLSDAVKHDLAEGASLHSRDFSGDRIQTSKDPDGNLIHYIESSDKEVRYGVKSLVRRREWAMKTIRELDVLQECADKLPAEHNRVIYALFYNLDSVVSYNGETVYFPRKQTVVQKELCLSWAGLRRQRIAAIQALVTPFMKARRERGVNNGEDGEVD